MRRQQPLTYTKTTVVVNKTERTHGTQNSLFGSWLGLSVEHVFVFAASFVFVFADHFVARPFATTLWSSLCTAEHFLCTKLVLCTKDRNFVYRDTQLFVYQASFVYQRHIFCVPRRRFLCTTRFCVPKSIFLFSDCVDLAYRAIIACRQGVCTNVCDTL